MHAFSAARGDATAIKEFRSDKLVALDRDKAEFCYSTLPRQQRPPYRRDCTSYGVSTLYLAAAFA